VTPPAGAANFVGYADTASGQTACGDCHLDQQAAWSQTKHAHAWADLMAGDTAAASCDACHAVDAYGSLPPDSLAGFLATHDARYHDVQCESCHGPGLAHVTDPSLANRPLASLAADTGVACGACHTGANQPQADNWVQSLHANSIPTSHIIGNASCDYCHVGQAALAAWGVQTNYREAADAATNPMMVTCAVCHDPHGSANPYQLRYPIDVRDTSAMLCMRCHQRNAKPTAPADTHPPMSPEGPVLLGFAGWFPPGYTGPDTIVATHGSAANANLCVTCHMPTARVTNAGDSLLQNYGGHLFIAAPCLDPNGVPTAGDCDISQRSFAACATSGCHGTPDAARSAMVAVQGRLALLDSALSSQLVQIPDSEFTADTVNTAIGARFNLQLAEKPGSEIHNPFLMETLLTSSIQQVETDYGIPPTIAVDLRKEIK
jgi:predicted CXXCH cytochrome family protein